MLESTNYLEAGKLWLCAQGVTPGVPSSYFFFFPSLFAAPFTLKHFLHVAPRTPFLLDFLSLTDSTSSVSFAGSSHRPDLQMLACSGPSPWPCIFPAYTLSLRDILQSHALIITHLGMTSKLTLSTWICPLSSTFVYSVAYLTAIAPKNVC